MPGGKIHAAIGGAGAAALSAAGIATAGLLAGLGAPPDLAISAGAGLLYGAWAGFFITPDIDHHKVTEEEARIYRFNLILGRVWHLYWMPYQRWNGGHRSGNSHKWPAGTLERFLWGSWLPLLLSIPLALMVESPGLLAGWPAALLSWSIQDALHIGPDRLVTYLRKAIRSGRLRWYHPALLIGSLLLFALDRLERRRSPKRSKVTSI